MEFGGEELLCGSCDVDDGHDKRDDETQGDDDGYEVAHTELTEVRVRKPNQTTSRQQRSINRMGMSTSPTLGWRNLRVNETKSELA